MVDNISSDRVKLTINKMRNEPDDRMHADNSFDFLRILAASAVLYSHSYALYGRPEPAPVIGQSYGSLAVALFFSISGFLVCQSWSRDPNITRFALRRALRIFPGLVVVVMLTALILGPVVTTVSVDDYFGSGTAWAYIRHAALALGNPELLGVFTNNPHPNSPNGSLWTLRYEIMMYVLLMMIGHHLPRSRLGIACLTAFVLFGSAWFILMIGHLVPLKMPFVWRLGTEFYGERIAYLGAFFFSGACMHLYADRIRLSWVAAIILLTTILASHSELIIMPLLWVFIPYAAILFALKSPRIFRKTNGVDYSYGIYIYAFPVQQSFSLLGMRYHLEWGSVLLFSALVTAVFASISWHLVEKPALSLKKVLILRFS